MNEPTFYAKRVFFSFFCYRHQKKHGMCLQDHMRAVEKLKKDGDEFFFVRLYCFLCDVCPSELLVCLLVGENSPRWRKMTEFLSSWIDNNSTWRQFKRKFKSCWKSQRIFNELFRMENNCDIFRYPSFQLKYPCFLQTNWVNFNHKATSVSITFHFKFHPL